MEGVLQLGPLMIATDRLVAVMSLWAFLGAGSIIARRTGTRADRAAWIAALVGLVAGRAGYVVEHGEAFAVEPWTAVAVWQGGFAITPGFVAALVTIVLMLGRQRATLGLAAALALLAAVHLVAVEMLAPPPRLLPAGPVIADMAGRPIPISSLRGRPVVINLWATWCPPCRREMPMMIDVAARSAIPVLLVNQGEDTGHIRAWLAGEGLADAAIRIDPRGTLGQAIGAAGMPTTLFVDADSRIRHSHTGEISRAALLAGLKDLERANK